MSASTLHFAAGPWPVTLSFGCHCHPASASPLRSVLVWQGGRGTWVEGEWRWHRRGAAGNTVERCPETTVRKEGRREDGGRVNTARWLLVPLQTLMTRLIEASQQIFIPKNLLVYQFTHHHQTEMVPLFWKSWRLCYPPMPSSLSPSLFLFSCPAHCIALFPPPSYTHGQCMRVLNVSLSLSAWTVWPSCYPLDPWCPRGAMACHILAAGTDYRRIHGTLITFSACHPPSQQPAPPNPAQLSSTCTTVMPLRFKISWVEA